MPRRTMTYCLSALLGSSLMLGTLPGDAFAAEAVDVPIDNADLAQPQLAKGTSPKVPTGWDGKNTTLFSAASAGRGDGLQAASLSRNGISGTLSTRLWRVQQGSRVTVTWADSPSPLPNCTRDDPTKGQEYQVSAGIQGASDADSANVKTETTQRGKANWREGRQFSFTAKENNPRISWSYLNKQRNACGPLVTHFRATQDPAPVPYDIKKARLPDPLAYQGTSPARPEDVVQHCLAGPRSCHFEKDERYSYRYYDRPRMVGQAFINCTRNTLTDERPVQWTELPYDSVTQYFSQNKESRKKPTAQGRPQQNTQKRPHQDDLRQGHQNLAVQIAAGFTRADGNPMEMATNNPLLFDRTEKRTMSVTVQPGEVSWIEVQAARERLSGTLIHSSKNERMDVHADVPSGSFGDRFYQRTGPMSKVELARCADARDNSRTPDNSIGAPTLRNAPHLTPAGQAPKGIQTRTIPLTVGKSSSRD
ncbi:hypothetical protein [Streptomyces huasconensis]|uniref:hypothetical protein n=1 Tax=Streptomyces huasconensis TaxID=1854574 RepID=UPI0033EF8D68